MYTSEQFLLTNANLLSYIAKITERCLNMLIGPCSLAVGCPNNLKWPW